MNAGVWTFGLLCIVCCAGAIVMGGQGHFWFAFIDLSMALGCALASGASWGSQ